MTEDSKELTREFTNRSGTPITIHMAELKLYDEEGYVLWIEKALQLKPVIIPDEGSITLKFTIKFGPEARNWYQKVLEKRRAVREAEMNELRERLKDLTCFKCGLVESEDERFIDTYIPCEDCGTHPAIECPSCQTYYDSVYSFVCAECGTVYDFTAHECESHPKADHVHLSDLHRGADV